MQPSRNCASMDVASAPARSILFAGLLVVITAACLGTPTRAPDVVGTVVDSTDLPGPGRRYTLEGGDFIDLDLDRAERLANSQGGQKPGTLLLAGEDRGTQWYMSLTADGACFLISS